VFQNVEPDLSVKTPRTNMIEVHSVYVVTFARIYSSGCASPRGSAPQTSYIKYVVHAAGPLVKSAFFFTADIRSDGNKQIDAPASLWPLINIHKISVIYLFFCPCLALFQCQRNVSRATSVLHNKSIAPFTYRNTRFLLLLI
jgi:hypothetical protein